MAIEDSLCQICVNLQLEMLDGDDYAWVLDWPLPFSQPWKRCPICRLVVACIAMQPDIGNFQPEGTFSRGSSIKGYFSGGSLSFSLMVAKSWPLEDAIEYYSIDHVIRSCPNGLDASNPISRSSAPYASAIKRWISRCQAEHGHHEPTKEKPPPLFRLVDVVSMRVVSLESLLQENQRISYWALSYVWGGARQVALTKQNQDALSKPESLEKLRSNGLPKTIVDAIELCRNARQRYLWIDALCILQDSLEKHAQVCAMDIIYNRASLVLVAASGADANAGLLPGLPDGSHPNVVKIEEALGRRLAACPTLRNVLCEVSQSPWHLRAWTLQEYALSRRAAIFTERNAILTCGNRVWKLNLDGTAQLGPADDLRRPDPSADPEGGIGTFLYMLVRRYLNRALSYETDILDALEGTLSRCLGGPERHFWGHPEAGFATWFTWSCKWFPGKCGRRRRGKMFPSWSWAGWMHQGIACCVLDPSIPPPGIDIYRVGSAGELIQLVAGQMEMPAASGTERRTSVVESMCAGIDRETLQSTCFLWTYHCKALLPEGTGGCMARTTESFEDVGYMSLTSEQSRTFHGVVEFLMISIPPSSPGLPKKVFAMPVQYWEDKKVYRRLNPDPFVVFGEDDWMKLGARLAWIPLA